METKRTPAHRNFVWHSSANNSSFSVSFPKAPDMNLTLMGAELYQDIEEHDRLVLHFKGHPTIKKQSLISGDPVEFIFKSDKLKTTWHGYIHHIEQPNTWQGGNTDIVCVSASWVLKDTDQKIYKNVTADQVVSKIAKSMGMSAVTQRHPRLRKSVAQAGQSFWQVLRSLAKQTGFALLVENTTITFVSKDKIFQSKKKSAPYFRYVHDEIDGVSPRELKLTGTVLEFSPIISDHAPEMGVRVDRVMSGTSSQTKTTIKTTHVSTKKNVHTGVVVPNEKYFKS